MYKHHMIIIAAFFTLSTIAMEQSNTNDLAITQALQRKYIGIHGWTIDTGNGEEFINVDVECIQKINSERLLKKHAISLIKNNLKADSYIRATKNKLCIFDIKTGESERKLEGHTEYINCCINTHNPAIIISGSADTTIKIWDLKTGSVTQTLSSHQNLINGLTVFHDNFASIAYDHSLKIWNFSSGQCQHHYSTGDEYKHCPESIMYGNNTLYTGLHSGKIMIIDPRLALATGTWKAHEMHTGCLIGSANNENIIYSGGWDHQAKQWDLRNVNACIKSMKIEKDNPCLANLNITNLYATKDGEKLFVTDMNNLYVWDLTQDIPKLKTICKPIAEIYENCVVVNDDETEISFGGYRGSYDDIIMTLTPNVTFELLKSLQKVQ